MGRTSFFFEFAINSSVQDSSGISSQQMVFVWVLQALVELFEGLHSIKPAQSWVSEV